MFTSEGWKRVEEFGDLQYAWLLDVPPTLPWLQFRHYQRWYIFLDDIQFRRIAEKSIIKTSLWPKVCSYIKIWHLYLLNVLWYIPGYYRRVSPPWACFSRNESRGIFIWQFWILYIKPSQMRTKFSLGRWVTRGKKTPKSTRKHAKGSGKLFRFFLFNIMAAAITVMKVIPSDLIKRGEIAILAISVHPNEILLVGLP